MVTRAELVTAIGGRYRVSSREERGRILDEFVELTGYHRKHAIRILSREPVPPAERYGRRVIYGPEVRDGLLALWNLSDRLCSKRLKEMIPLLLPAAVAHGVIADRADLRHLILKVSPATIDRLISEARVRAQNGRRRKTGMSSAIRREVPIRTFNDWNDPQPGFVEADFVAHGGASTAGSFIQTLVLTDIATGWTECVPVITRSAALVIEAIRTAITLFPFPLQGIDFDNDSSFMNAEVVPWCRAAGLTVTRSRAYKKNDQAWVEQKNGAVVRRLVGYGRLEGLTALRCLNRLYAASRLQVNLFHPSFKLISKQRIGAKVQKHWDKPRTPAERLAARPDVASTAKDTVDTLRQTSDPVDLIRRIRVAQAELGQSIDRRGRGVQIGAEESAICAARGIDAIARAQQPAKLHRRSYTRRKPVPRKPFRLDPFETSVKAWLSLDPSLTGLEVHGRLVQQHGQIVSARTVQRLVKKLRAELLMTEIAEQSQTNEDAA